MTIAQMMTQELEQEAQTTRRLLERVPGAHLAWKPHAKARALGELAMHVAVVPGAVAELAATSPVQAPDFRDPTLTHAADLLPALDDSIARAKAVLAGLDDTAMKASWQLMLGDRELVNVPRMAFLRSVMLNHWYHHRGQLSVYLRELGVALPSIYGPSADENPFAQA